MTIAKKILITTETREVVIVRECERPGPTDRCTICAADSPLLSLDDAVQFARVSTLRLVHHLEAGLIHGCESPDGRLFICQGSLKPFEKEHENEKHHTFPD